MSDLSELAHILIGSRTIDRGRWAQAARVGGGDLARTLAALSAEPPPWWDGTPPPPPGLTAYQRAIVIDRFEADDLANLHRDLALNQFLLLDKLGQGGQGEVYRSRQLSPPRFAAVKTLVRDTETSRRRFESEARAMMKVQHPSVARFYLYERVRDLNGEPTDEYLIAMELVEGTVLHRLVHRMGPVPWRFAVRWAIQLLGGLAAIHRSGFVHGDVKPENVMVVGPAPRPEVAPAATAAKLLDFGAVRRVGGSDDIAAAARTFVGTPEYAPPEQWTGQVVAASDVYALGGAMYFTLVGRCPYQRERRNPVAYRDSHMRDPVPDLRAENPEVPAAVNEVFQRMMAKEPGDRGSADELAAEFELLLSRGSGGPRPPIPPTAQRKAKPLKSRPSPTARPPRQSGPLDRLAHPILATLERLFIPGHHRALPGEEPAMPERLIALARRPVVLVLLGFLLVLLIWWRW